jgi:single-strand DNA-binding protein
MPTDLKFSGPLLAAASESAPAEDTADVTNLVFLAGSITEPAEHRELAGGIPVVRWTLRVPRGPEHPGSDLMDCVALSDDLKSRALEWPIGMPVSVVGALRRRFFRAGGRTTTRVEIEVERVTELDAPAELEPHADSVGVEHPDQ